MEDNNINICQKPVLNFSYDGDRKQLCENLKTKEEKDKFNKAMNIYKEQLWNYFICRIKRELSNDETAILKKAYDMAYEAHRCQFRKTGSLKPYICHPVEVALIVLNEMNLDIITATAALLHDVLEDSELYSYDEIKRNFGEAVAITVEGVTKITKLGNTNIDRKLETFRKMILSISKEYRVILVKIADRLHNMRTFDGMPHETVKRKVPENLVIYAQFAKAIGMFDIKNEMEDLSLKYLYPNIYKKLVDFDQKIEPERQKVFKEIKIHLYQILTPLGYNIKIVTVERSLYEVWQKIIENEGLNEQNWDQFTFNDFINIHNRKSLRIIVDVPRGDIYTAAVNIYSEISTYYGVVENKMIDYINHSKSNGFRALIFDIIKRVHGFLNPTVEIQILSKEDHTIAQKGANFEKIQNRINLKKEDESVIDFINRILKQLETDFVYVYTPKGDVITLPKGSTVLDFAFEVNINLGLKCIGAKVNYKIPKSPFHKIHSGEIIHILTSDNAHPEQEWLKFVITPKAKSAIINYLKTQQKEKQQKETKKIDITTKNLPIVVNSYAGYIFADCCTPTPEVPAVAIQDEKGNTIIHRADCTQLAAMTNLKNVIPVQWALKESLYEIKVKAMDRLGLLKDLTELISSKLKINIKEVHMFIDDKDKLVNGQFVVKVHHNTSPEDEKKKKSENKGTGTDNEEKQNDEDCPKEKCTPKDLYNLANELRTIDGIIEVIVHLKN